MAFIYMDYLGPMINNFRINSTVYQRFAKRWAYVDNLYHKELLFYAGGEIIEDVQLTRFLKSLAISIEDLKDNDYDEVERAWFWFNKDKQPSSEVETHTTTGGISSALNSMLTVGDKVRVKLNYGGSTQFFLLSHKEDWIVNSVGEIEGTGMNTEEVFDQIHSDPWMYIANILDETKTRTTTEFHTINTGTGKAGFEEGRKNIWNTDRLPKGVGRFSTTTPTSTTVLAPYSSYEDSKSVQLFSLALLDHTHGVFEPTLDDEGKMKVFSSTFSAYGKPGTVSAEDMYDENGTLSIVPKETVILDKTGLSSGHSIEYEFTFKGSTEASTLVKEINDNMQYLYVREKKNRNQVMDTMQKRAMNTLRASPQAKNWYGKWDDYFIQDYLIKDKVDAMPRHQFVNLVSDCLDTDFKAESASMFERVFAVLVVVVAIVITFYTVGVFGPAAYSTLALAQGLGYASLVLTVGGLMLSQMGLSAMNLVKTIGEVAQVVGLAASLVGVMSAVTTAFDRLAAEAAAKGTIQSAGEYTVGAFVSDSFSNMVTKATSGLTNIIDIVLNPMQGMLGSPTAAGPTGISGWLGRLENGMQMYTKFMSSSQTSTNAESPTEEQLDKTTFQYPDTMYELQEQTIYEPDALQKMSVMKDQQFGLSRTEKLLDQIA